MSEFDEKLKNYVIGKLSDKSHRGYYEDIDYIMEELIEDIYGTKFIDRVCQTGDRNDEEFQWFVDAVIEKFEYDDDLPDEEDFIDNFFYEDPNAPEDEELMSDPEARSAYEKALQETGKKYDGIDAVYKSKTHVVREAFEDFIFHDLCGNVNVKKSNLNKKGGNIMRRRDAVTNGVIQYMETAGYFNTIADALEDAAVLESDMVSAAKSGGPGSKDFGELFGAVLDYLEQHGHDPESDAERYYNRFMSDSGEVDGNRLVEIFYDVIKDTIEEYLSRMAV